MLAIADKGDFSYASVNDLGTYEADDRLIGEHIEKVLELPLVDAEAIRAKNFKVAIDCVNSTGGIALPRLLKALGVSETLELYCEPNGIFPHNPEPLPEHLTEICELVREKGADVAFVVDPDVDRLAIVTEKGELSVRNTHWWRWPIMCCSTSRGIPFPTSLPPGPCVTSPLPMAGAMRPRPSGR